MYIYISCAEAQVVFGAGLQADGAHSARVPRPGTPVKPLRPQP